MGAETPKGNFGYQKQLRPKNTDINSIRRASMNKIASPKSSSQAIEAYSKKKLGYRPTIVLGKPHIISENDLPKLDSTRPSMRSSVVSPRNAITPRKGLESKVKPKTNDKSQ